MERWTAVATYRINGQAEIRTGEFEELGEDFQQWVEEGPDWNDLVDIRVTYNLAEAED